MCSLKRQPIGVFVAVTRQRRRRRLGSSRHLLLLAFGVSLLAPGASSANEIRTAVKPLRAINGVACHRQGTTTSSILDIYTYSCGTALARSYTISISIQRQGTAYGGSPVKSDVKIGQAVSSTRAAVAGHASVIVIASRGDGNARAARSDARAIARRLARINARETR